MGRVQSQEIANGMDKSSNQEHHLQVHGCCLYKLHTKKADGSIETLELKEAREKAHKF